MTNPRLQHLDQLLATTHLDGIVLNPGPTLTYLSGLNFHLMERPTVLLYKPSAGAALILPELEAGKLQGARMQVKGFTYNDNPATWGEAFEKATAFLQLDGQVIGVEPNRLRFLELDYLQKAIPQARFVSGESILNQVRLQKDAQELAAMRQAVHIAQAGLKATLPSIKIGVSEQEIAAELILQLLRAGSEGELPFQPIVASGPNSANPHAVPSVRKLAAGDLVVIDWGAACQGYFSDLTRTLAIGKLDPELYTIYQAVQGANAAGRQAGKPGIPAGDVDWAARKEIEAAGYGPQFFHRVGHGLGMETHEPPYMFAENTLLLQPGMVYTVEPGIYLSGRGGVRIEDNVAVTTNGCEVLSDFPRDLITID